MLPHLLSLPSYRIVPVLPLTEGSLSLYVRVCVHVSCFKHALQKRCYK